MATRAFSLIIALAMILAPLGIGPAQSQPQSQLFETRAKQVMMIDAETGTILYSKDADKLIPPASLAKLMTMEVVFHALKVGRLSMDDTFAVCKNAWTKGGAKSGGSTMFAKLNSQIRVEDLIQGVIVQSANDACITIAEGLAGTEENFAALMTERAREIGLTKSVFKNSNGLPAEGQVVTMRELVDARPAYLADLSGILPLLRPARVHLEQDHAAEPQPVAGDGDRRRRHEDGLHRGLRLCDRRLDRA